MVEMTVASRTLLLATLVLLLIDPLGIQDSARAFCLLSCNNLDRDKAAAMLSILNFPDEIASVDLSTVGQSLYAIQVSDEQLVRNNVQTLVFGSNDEANLVLSRVVRNDIITTDLTGLQHLRLLAQEHLIKALKVNTRAGGNPSIEAIYWTPILADDVQPFFKNYNGTLYREGDAGSYNVAVAKWKFGAVTGIAGEGNQRLVQYNITSEPTAVGLKLGVKSTIQGRGATFILFDDGWRLAR